MAQIRCKITALKNPKRALDFSSTADDCYEFNREYEGMVLTEFLHYFLAETPYVARRTAAFYQHSCPKDFAINHTCWCNNLDRSTVEAFLKLKKCEEVAAKHTLTVNDLMCYGRLGSKPNIVDVIMEIEDISRDKAGEAAKNRVSLLEKELSAHQTRFWTMIDAAEEETKDETLKMEMCRIVDGLPDVLKGAENWSRSRSCGST